MGETAPNPIHALVAEARERLNQEIAAQAQQLENLEKSFEEARGRVKREISGQAEQLESLQNSLGESRERQKKLAEETEQQIQNSLGELRERQRKLAEETEQQIQNSLGELRERQKKLAEETEQQIQRLAEKSLAEARERQNSLKAAIEQQLDQLAKYEPPPVAAPLDKLLGSVRNLITATLPEQVLEVLTEEAEQMGARAAVFDVRGKAAWGAAARGFAGLSEKALHAVAVPLNQDGPFRRVFETGGHEDTNAEQLKRNRNVLDKFKPGHKDAILLLPIRSSGSVSAIVYLDAVDKPAPLAVDALKILSEFAGAQLDRLMALSGGIAVETEKEERAEPEAEPEEAAASKAGRAEAAEPEPAQAEAAHAEPESPPAEMQQQAAPAAASAPEPAPVSASAAAAAPAPSGDISQLSEEEQKYHKDARRFAKLLISEIELYNKAKVADGRKNKDLYKRLKSDIERSRQTYQKRFSKPLSNRADYFHDDLVRLLANGDASLLGPDYPGPSA